MYEEYERFAGVPGLHVVYLDPVDPHDLVLAVLGVQEAGGGRGPGLHPEQGAPSHQQLQGEPYEEQGDGDDQPHQEGRYPQPLDHLL